MSDISPIGRPSSAYQLSRDVQAERPPATAAAARATDRVELSSHAQLLNKLAELPDIREDVVERIKAELTAGVYDADGKLDDILADVAEDLDIRLT